VTTDKQKENLKRGNMDAAREAQATIEAQRAAVSQNPPRDPKTNRPVLRGAIDGDSDARHAREVVRKNQATDKALGDSAESGDVDDVLIQLFREASLAAARGLRKWNAKRGEPSKLTIEATREARQLAIVASDILKARGRDAEAGEWFADLETHLASGGVSTGGVSYHCTRCGDPVRSGSVLDDAR
jgi:hypothetical protein